MNDTPATPPGLDAPSLRARQRLLLEEMQKRSCGLAVLTRTESVQWLTGLRVAPLFFPCASIDADGHVTLVVPSRAKDSPSVADTVVSYEEKRLSTSRDASEQVAASLSALLDAMRAAPDRAGCEFTSAPRQLTLSLSGDWWDFDPVMVRLRRQKHPDELALLAWANRANEAMYARAREVIAPGLSELDLYNELHAVAVNTLGEPLTYFGQDFRCGARGGAPRRRAAEEGELWVLDLGVGFRGYYTDNARTIAVGEPTSEQRQAWGLVADVFPYVESVVKPGVSCREVFQEVSTRLAAASPWVFNHHLGHGVGLAPQEGPRINPNWDDTFAVGDVIAVEPGLYHESLRFGVRLEQNYLVTATGVQLLSDWPLEL